MMWTLANKQSFEKRKRTLEAISDRRVARDEAKHLGTTSSASKGGYENEFDEEMGREELEQVDRAMKEVQAGARQVVVEQRQAEAAFLAEKDQIFLAKKLFKEIEERKLAVDFIFLRAFLAVFVNNGRLEEAVHVLEELYPKLGFPLQTHEYRAILQLCWSLDNFPLAQAYWTKMREQGVSPDAGAHMYYAHAAAKAKRYEHVLLTVREMTGSGLLPKPVEFEILRKELVESEAIWVWREIAPLIKGKLILRPLNERKKYLY